MNSINFGLMALLLVQVALSGASWFIYSRMRSTADAERAARPEWGIKVEAALGTARDAKQAVDTIELAHYKSLRSMFEDQVLQIGQLKGDIVTLKKEIEQLTTKVQTLQRMDRGFKKKAEEAAPAMPGPEGPFEGESPLDEAVRNGVAYRLPVPGGAQQYSRPPGFGNYR